MVEHQQGVERLDPSVGVDIVGIVRLADDVPFPHPWRRIEVPHDRQRELVAKLAIQVVAKRHRGEGDKWYSGGVQDDPIEDRVAP